MQRPIDYKPTPLIDLQIENLEKLSKDLKIRNLSTAETTYLSDVNYRGDLDKPLQRWFNYKEGYSLDLNFKLFELAGFSKGETRTILDPFAGSGTTLLAAKAWGFKGIGFEVNPFSSFLAEAKTRNYSSSDVDSIMEVMGKIRNLTFSGQSAANLPALKMAGKVFSPEKWLELVELREHALANLTAPKVRMVVELAWLGILERNSNYRKAGNGLKAKRYKKPRPIESAKDTFLHQLEIMCEDIRTSLNGPEPEIHRVSSLELNSRVSPGSVDLVIFSPPYANCFDYTEIYKIELWFGGFVATSEDLRTLRKQSLRSHLNHRFENLSPVIELEPTLSMLEQVHLWDTKIPKMLIAYFDEMRRILEATFEAMKPGAYCSIVVSNSAYGGIVVATDLILAAICKRIGFSVSEIDVARTIITSSQQFGQTAILGQYLRESLVVVRKEIDG